MKAVIDIETGGFAVGSDALVEVALLIFDDEMKVRKEWSAIISPYALPGREELTNHGADAEAVHGISVEQREAEGKAPEVVCDEIEILLTQHNVTELVGHNIVKFDMPRILNFLSHFSILEQSLKNIDLYDTLVGARNWFIFPSYSLESCCRFLNIEHNDAHRAASDCRATFEVYKKIMEHENGKV